MSGPLKFGEGSMEFQGDRATVAEPFIDMMGYWKHMCATVYEDSQL